MSGFRFVLLSVFLGIFLGLVFLGLGAQFAEAQFRVGPVRPITPVPSIAPPIISPSLDPALDLSLEPIAPLELEPVTPVLPKVREVDIYEPTRARPSYRPSTNTSTPSVGSPPPKDPVEPSDGDGPEDGEDEEETEGNSSDANLELDNATTSVDTPVAEADDAKSPPWYRRWYVWVAVGVVVVIGIGILTDR